MNDNTGRKHNNEYQPDRFWDEVGFASEPGTGDSPGKFGTDEFGNPLYLLPSWSSPPQYSAYIPPESRVLDIGSGIGLQVGKLTQRGIFAVGCDISYALLNVAKQNCCSHGLNRWRFIQWDGHMLPFLNSSFDRVTTNTVLQHIVDDQALHALFREASRILETNGLLLVSELVSPIDLQTAPHVKLRSVDTYLSIASEYGLSSIQVDLSPSLFVSIFTLVNRFRRGMFPDVTRQTAATDHVNPIQSPTSKIGIYIKYYGKAFIAKLSGALNPIITILKIERYFCGQAVIIFKKCNTDSRKHLQ